ncbi:MAG: hypothetical protein WD063_14420 [Pirellulales bacterium]
MNRHPMLSKLFAPAFGATRRRRPPARRIGLEPLEDRAMLTAYIVDTDADVVANDGLISLREAVEASSTNAPSGDAPAGMANGDAITFDPSLDGLPIHLMLGELSITDDLLISGQALDITIDAGGASRVFAIHTGEVVALAHLTLTGGAVADDGGAIAAAGGGVTHLRDMRILDSTASGHGGGGLFIDASMVHIFHSLISGNTADGATGSGGGILNGPGGRLRVFQSEISENTANRAGGGIEDNSGAGLGVTLWHSALEGNNAGVAPAAAAPGNGGGLHVTGPGDVAIFASRVIGNVAAAEGGGLWNGTGRMTVVHTVVRENSASGDAADDGGGGIFNNGGTLFVTWSTIAHNTADGAAGSGGGIFSNGGHATIVASRIDGNSANRAGGGIEVVAANVGIVFSSLAENVAGPVGSAAPGNGGGLHVSGAHSTVRVQSSRVTGNTAASEGGGLWNDEGSTMNVVASTISRNQALGTALDNGGGGIFNNGGVLDIVFSTINWNSSAGSGGGLFLGDGGHVHISASQIFQNEADENGGGIYNNADLVLQFSSVHHNSAADGGGIYTDTLGITDLVIAFLFGNNPNDLAGPGMVI